MRCPSDQPKPVAPEVDLDELEKLANASKVSWESCPQLNKWYQTLPLYEAIEDDADSEFIAAMSPAVTLALIAETRALRVAKLDVERLSSLLADEHATCVSLLGELAAEKATSAQYFDAMHLLSEEYLSSEEFNGDSTDALKRNGRTIIERRDALKTEQEQLRIENANLRADLGMYKNHLRIADLEIMRLGGK